MSDTRRDRPPSRRGIYEGRQLATIAARWDARAGSWDRDLQDPACHLNEDDAYRRFLAETRRVVAGRREFCGRQGVIDLGCGTGLVLAEIGSSFAWAVGVDLSPEMIRLAEAKRLPNSRFMVADGFNLAALGLQAGAVLSRGVLLSHYGRELAGPLLAAARTALGSGGFLLFDFLNAAAKDRHAHVAEEKTHFTGDELLDVATRVGFRNATILGEADRRVRLLLAEHP